MAREGVCLLVALDLELSGFVAPFLCGHHAICLRVAARIRYQHALLILDMFSNFIYYFQDRGKALPIRPIVDVYDAVCLLEKYRCDRIQVLVVAGREHHNFDAESLYLHVLESLVRRALCRRGRILVVAWSDPPG